MLKEAEEKVKQIRDRLKTAQSRQKSYYDQKHRKVSFEPGEYVYLRVSPIRGLQRFKIKGKLAPKFRDKLSAPVGYYSLWDSMQTNYMGEIKLSKPLSGVGRLHGNEMCHLG